jgi:hypothetical protein
MGLPKKIIDSLELLRNQQAEIKEAMTARMGDVGPVWTECVMEAACACAVIKHFHDECDNTDMQQELEYAIECVTVCGALKLLDKTHGMGTEVEKKIEKEFAIDVHSIVRKSFLRITVDDLEGDE